MSKKEDNLVKDDITDNSDVQKKEEISSEENSDIDIEELNKIIREKTIKVDDLTRKLSIVSSHVKSIEQEHKKKLDEISLRKNEEIKKKEKAAISKVIIDILAPIESLSNFILPLNEEEYASDEKLFNFIKGSKMTFGLIDELLNKYGVNVIKPKHGDKFDPNFHKAVQLQKNDNLPNDSVMELLQLGYKMGGVVLRYASVIVSN